MSQLREMLEQRLLDGYRAYYDVEPMDDGSSLKALCAYHSRDAQYVLSKKAQLWAAENHEYLYLFSLPRLDAAGAGQIFERALEDGMPRIRPHSQHMCTYLTAVVLCDSAAPDALELVKKMKKHQDFKLSLHGWMEFRIAVADLSAKEIAANRCARDLARGLRPFVDSVTKIIGEEKI